MEEKLRKSELDWSVIRPPRLTNGKSLERTVQRLISIYLKHKALPELKRFRFFQLGGTDSWEFFPYRCSVALTEQLGMEVVEFPGGHGGYNTILHKEFANKLNNVLVNC